MATPPYDHAAIEKKWQQFWDEHKTFKTELDTSKPKYYVLDMFPYPSGDGLHVGHPEGYTATDIVARYKRMRGFNVLHPMGWDAFGLPAERHAVRTGEHPSILTQKNCNTFREQIKALGLSYDWDREINTTDPKYYKWTQWIFTVLFERGLAYETEAAVNWCPALGTVLANEEVKDGKYVETGDPVEKRMMRQWMLKITDYAEQLLAGLDDVDWPEGIKTMQREWIGRSEGADVEFKVANGDEAFTVFTTRPDTLFGATYCVLAPEHPLTKSITTDGQRDAVDAYVEEAGRKSAQDRMRDEREKTGVFTGAYALNPVNGKEVPIWVADYVLAEYGYGAIMAVPAHDERDHAFARKFDLPITQVVEGGVDIRDEAYTGDGPLINSSNDDVSIDGLNVTDAKKKITTWLESQGVGTGTVNYKLRDWLFARQRYWGEPFPVVRTADGTVKTVPLKDLPVALPDLDEYKPTDDGHPPLARATEWLNATDPDTGHLAMRDTNTMPQWAGSCWYFLRFCDPTNDKEAWSKEAEEYWMPVDLYIGGAEHAVLHLLYSRFWHKVLYDAGYVHTAEPFKKLYNQGMILAHTHQTATGKYRYPNEVREAIIEYKSSSNRLLWKREVYADLKELPPQTTSCTMVDFWLLKQDGERRLYPEHAATTVPDLPNCFGRLTQNGKEVIRAPRWIYVQSLEGGFLNVPDLDAFKHVRSSSEGEYCEIRRQGSDDYERVKTVFEVELLFIKPDKSVAQPWEIEYDDSPYKCRLRDSSLLLRPLYRSYPVVNKSDGWIDIRDEKRRTKDWFDRQIEKMSKSRFNVVKPEIVVETYGADSMRLYEMFMGPLDRDKPWSDEGVQGVHRFLKRVWALYVTEDGLSEKFVRSGGDEAALKSLHKTIKAVTNDIENLQFNTAIARMMEFVNDAGKAKALDRAWMETFVLILAPFAPHMAEDLWARLGHEDTLAYAEWPTHDESLLAEDTVEIPVQVNGKMRGKINVAADADKDAMLAAAKADESIAGHLDGKNLVKEIVVPGRMVNFVVK